ncbi:MAG: hypothetical protein ABSH09_29430, partial [Bryobacteraceae bacterium]|jgi:hypothetical protein
LGTPRFDPHSIPTLSVIRLPYLFDGAERAVKKRFVVLAHIDGHAICIKATSKTTIYETNCDMMAGCVYYRAGELDCFPESTAIQPDNQIPIRHYLITSAESRGELEVWQLPHDFREKLIDAIENSITLNRRQKERLKDMGCP